MNHILGQTTYSRIHQTVDDIEQGYSVINQAFDIKVVLFVTKTSFVELNFVVLTLFMTIRTLPALNTTRTGCDMYVIETKKLYELTF
jgi:hypothetical protein